MHLQIFPTFCVFMIINFIHFPILLRADNELYTDCSRSYPCANIPDIPYPFWGGDKPEYCGNPIFKLNCQGEAPNITIGSRPYRVLSINNTTFTLTVARDEFWNNNCPTELHNATLDTTPFQYAPNTEELMLYYGCRVIATGLISIDSILNRFNCSKNQITDSFGIYTAANLPSTALITSNVNCSNGVSVRVNQTAAATLADNASGNITQVLNSGFGLLWEANNTDCQSCVGSGGRCGTDSTRPGSLVCYCSDGSYLTSCNSIKISSGGGGSPTSIKIVLPIVGAIVAGIGLGCFFFSCRERRKRKAAQSTQDESKDISSIPLSKSLTTPPSNFTRSIPSYPSSKSDFGKASTYFGAQIFSYTELEEATNHFDPSRELGDGGFGTVYYGQLQDGRIVAVKRLYENNFKRVEQFMNEVEILTRLRHDYLVTLFGCTSKRSRELLLVYEYIPNGTVADHLHGKRSNSGLLSWPVRDRLDINLANMAIKKIQNRALHELVDPFLGFETNTSVRRMTTLVAELAFRCLQMERDMRPSMEEILKALRGIKDDGSNAQVDVVDIVIEEDVGILKENPPPVSPRDSAATSNEKSVSNSTAPNSSG
ncbi:protein kinase superfamily protein [Actinidia rufa]|uniref:non-specific serine/threonine protein kinase n=1 Tax=Actinidia rufa TaxID=165716 RepID=A0A7J0EE85_9ERIC|nr:protein kinase superfamily protein [Actinidia rufa]